MGQNKKMTFYELGESLLKEISLPLDEAEVEDASISNYGNKLNSPITNLDFQLICKLDYGSSEGIYLDIFIETLDEHGNILDKFPFIIVKTLKTNEKGMIGLAQIQGYLMIAFRRFLRVNRQLLQREGYEMIVKEKSDSKGWIYYEAKTLEKIKEIYNHEKHLYPGYICQIINRDTLKIIEESIIPN